jgi:two-component system, OmpR family, sensor kinase
MFTSLQSRLWLSYALVVTASLTVVALVLLIFLIRNPVLSRQTQQQLRTVANTITAKPQAFLADSVELQRFAEMNGVRILMFNTSRQLLMDTHADEAELPFPRRNLINRTAQTAIDASGKAWLYIATRLSDRQVLVVAAPRPRVPVLNIFADEFLFPIIQGGLIAMLFSLILAFALSRWVADPLQKVVVTASQYPSDQVKPIEVRGPREVQTLTHAFNSMLARVQSSQRSQKDFVANVSHEMKTPLTAIQGFAQAILDGTADTPEARNRAAQIIYDESTRMHRMSLDLLELVRLEAGTADLDRSPVDLVALLQGVVEKFSIRAQNAGVELAMDVPDDLPSIIADGDRLAQVFTNLVDNALKFTPAPGRVRLSAKKAGDGIELSVADTGMGVTRDALPRLFDRFYQADPARAGGKNHGAGLGLAIVKEIIQAHGGKIGVRSQVGSGTTLVIHLPLKIN